MLIAPVLLRAARVCLCLFCFWVCSTLFLDLKRFPCCLNNNPLLVLRASNIPPGLFLVFFVRIVFGPREEEKAFLVRAVSFFFLHFLGFGFDVIEFLFLNSIKMHFLIFV